MADHSAIEWTDASWNPLRGCSRVSTGCQHCYAERVAARFSGPGQPYHGLIHPGTGAWNGAVRLVTEALGQPLRWTKPRLIFVNSMSDVFHESVPFEQIAAIFGVMAAAPQHTFQVLTKRPARALAFFQWREAQIRKRELEWEPWRICEEEATELVKNLPAIGCQSAWPLANLWLGVSVENQASADERIPLLLQCPASVRWLSCEPLLGPIDLRFHIFSEPTGSTRTHGGKRQMELRRPADGGLHWVVAGGESGTGARPMHPDWARSLRDQCAAADVPFLFKQWGEWAPNDSRADRMFIYHDGSTDIPDDRWPEPENNGETHIARVGKKAAGRILDGSEHNAYPETR